MVNAVMKSFNYPHTLIKEYDNWVVLLRPMQVTVGSLVLVEKSDAVHLGKLSQDSWTEFAVVCKEVEDWTRRIFGAEKFNYMALMMVDPNVHFHFVPRYSQPVEVAGEAFLDADWPEWSKLGRIEMTSEQLNEISEKLRSIQ